ncbi:hypothetical protein [Pseudomonas asplenii]|uniref:Glycosyl hydrolases family 43 n=1 Tax=Pseudomonas asplenii TaxID=53407 RepID=A0A1H6MJM1_9PSED|nr:hypothetical protein [Pseudomonas fuscovaginae]SEH97774.1 hypothetical protein SAMN05216581_0953 [Pseudomonas fuscovaginae]
MLWKKIVKIFDASTQTPAWAKNSALTPTPFLLTPDVIRIYAGFRDEAGISRIGYVDVSSQDPTKIIAVSPDPVLSEGNAGCFDDNGVILGDVVRDGTNIRMYYVGFQKVQKAKFLAFTGLATSQDGNNFTRISEAPILDRANDARMIRAIHTAIYDEGCWKIWYAVGNGWCDINGIQYPRYNIWYTESPDGITFPGPHQLCIDVEGDEYRIGRPSVYKIDGRYIMFYTKGGVTGKDYFPGVAYSDDGKNWSRKDSELGMSLSEGEGFDNRHLCYPRICIAGEKVYAFYNGNDMGVEGIGLMELVRW